MRCATTETIAVSPTAYTFYTVTVTLSGCSGMATASVNVNQNPNATISATANPVCMGDSTTLSVSYMTGETLVHWNGGLGTLDNIKVWPNTTTTYTVTVSAFGCTNTGDIVVTVNQNPTPVITGNTSICMGATGTLDAGTGYSSYYWNTEGLRQKLWLLQQQGHGRLLYLMLLAVQVLQVLQLIRVLVLHLPLQGLLLSVRVIQVLLMLVQDMPLIYGILLLQQEKISVTTAGTYTVTVTSTSSGCSGSASVSVMVNNNPTPVINGQTSICSGGSANLLVSTSATYIWSTSATTQSITVSNAGTYSVTVSLNGCTGSASTTVSVASNPTPTITGPTTMCPGSNLIF